MKKLQNLLFALAIAVTGLALASCASTAEVLVNKDPGSFYGNAFAATEAEAQSKAYLDLVYSVLSETNSLRPGTTKASFVLSQEIKDAFAPLKLKPERSEKKSATRYDVVYRLPRAQWEKVEGARLARLDKELGGAFASIKSSSKPVAERIKDAAALLAALDRSGALNKVVGQDGSLLNGQVEAFCRDAVSGLSLSAQPASGLVKAGAAIVVQAQDKAGKAASSLPLSLVWKAEGKETDPLALATDGSGKAEAPIPADPAFGDQRLVLSASANFESLQPGLAFLRRLDASLSADFSYRNSAVAAAQDSAAKVQGGAYDIGAVKQDKRAGSIERQRKATVASFLIDRELVTNADYKVYLDATNAGPDEYPDYWDNPDFNKPSQPVIGVSLEEAEKYAAWLSSVQGVRKRLPTEEEYEVAARGGQASVYPWGDELPSDGGRATYSGNSSATTAVGSRAAGKNPLGLDDMAGNVWEWTTSAPAGTMSGDQSFRIVKGGSYMDGQYELRISNRVLRDPGQRYPDVGFRLVSEVVNE